MRRVVALSLAALVFAGCGGDESAAPTTAVVTVTTPVADATIATTPPPPSSSSSTTVVATTLPTTTTTVPTEDLIKKAVQDYTTAYQVCGEKPAECVPESFTAAQGSARGILTEFVSGLVAEGLYFSTDRRGQYLVAESLNIGSPSEFTATYCMFNAGIVLGPDGPDGQPTIVNDTIVSVRYEYGLFLEEQTWQVGRQREVAQLGEGNLCPPSG